MKYLRAKQLLCTTVNTDSLSLLVNDDLKFSTSCSIISSLSSLVTGYASLWLVISPTPFTLDHLEIEVSESDGDDSVLAAITNISIAYISATFSGAGAAIACRACSSLRHLVQR